MVNKKGHKNPVEREYEIFVNSLIRFGIEFEIVEESKIKKNCGKGIYFRVKEILSQVDPKEFLFFVFREGKEYQSCWPAKNYPGSVIINMARFLDPSEFIKVEKEAKEVGLTNNS